MDWDSFRTVYVRFPNWVGDVVLATPFLRCLREAAPKALILAHGKRHTLDLLAGQELYDRDLALESTHDPLWPIREGRRVKRTWGHPDLALLLPNSFSSALVAYVAGARVRAGYRLNGRGALLTHGLAVKKEGLLRPVPMVDYYLGLLRHLGASTEGVPRRPVLAPDEAARAYAEAFLTRYGLNAPSSRIWALNLGGSWETKQWIPAYAGKLARILRRRGITPLLLRGPDEAELAREVCDAAGETLAGAEEVVGLRDLAAVMSRCELLVTTDSGPRHFGVAAGVPVLVLVGPTHPGYTQVDYPGLRVVCEQVDCWPCHLKRCPIDFRCMRKLTPQRVLEAGLELLSSLEDGARRPPLEVGAQ